MEQSPVFLVALWLHAVFMSSETATCLGWTWIALRVMYPFLWLLNGKFTMQILLSTMPQYAIVTYLMFSTVLKHSYSIDIKGMLMNNDWFGVGAFFVIFNVIFLVSMMLSKNVFTGIFRETTQKSK